VNKKVYIIPEIFKIDLDNTISLQMASQPEDPPPLSNDRKGSEPFASPFGDKPFS
jgi:hypothetical protein